MPQYLTWRQDAALIIEATAAEWLRTRGKSFADLPYLPAEERKLLLKALSAAYPFGRREMYPYKAWGLALKDFKKLFHPTAALRRHYETEDVLQGKLF